LGLDDKKGRAMKKGLIIKGLTLHQEEQLLIRIVIFLCIVVFTVFGLREVKKQHEKRGLLGQVVALESGRSNQDVYILP
jgi:hypothetical protein